MEIASVKKKSKYQMGSSSDELRRERGQQST